MSSVVAAPQGAEQQRGIACVLRRSWGKARVAVDGRVFLPFVGPDAPHAHEYTHARQLELAGFMKHLNEGITVVRHLESGKSDKMCIHGDERVDRRPRAPKSQSGRVGFRRARERDLRRGTRRPEAPRGRGLRSLGRCLGFQDFGARLGTGSSGTTARARAAGKAGGIRSNGPSSGKCGRTARSRATRRRRWPRARCP